MVLQSRELVKASYPRSENQSQFSRGQTSLGKVFVHAISWEPVGDLVITCAIGGNGWPRRIKERSQRVRDWDLANTVSLNHPS